MAAGAAGVRGGADRSQAERLMDDYLRANGLYRRRIAKDGSCLFRAVAEQVLHCQGLHTKVRAECVQYLRQNRELYESFIEGDFEEYLQRLQDPQSWVGQVEISALAVLYKHDFIIYQNPGEPPVYVTENGYPDKVQLCFLNGNHYDSVYPASFAKNAAMCQSILYELLYERVCGVDHNVITSNMRGSKTKEESEESDLDEGEDFWSSEATGKTAGVNSKPPYRGRGRGQTRGGGRVFLPNKVQDSLNPHHFRNVEYDVWIKSKKAQQRRDFCMAAGMQYAVGDKCQVQLTSNGRYYSAYIEEVSPNNGPVTVFIEELEEKHTVPLWNLRTPSEGSWSTGNEKGKRQSVSNGNEHSNDWETRGGRKPARSVSIPYGSQTPAVSTPSSRIQKQHSWPPQAPVETQGKNANTRKSDLDVGVLGVSPAEEEELLVLELLHKDENNFPTLEASAQAAAGGGGGGSGEGGKRAEKKGSRKKADTETKESLQKADRGKHRKKVSVVQEQRISPPIEEKLSSSSPPATPPSANSPVPSAPKATKPNPASLATAPQTAPVPSRIPTTFAGTATGRPQTAPAASTASAQSQAASGPSTQTAAVPTPTVPLSTPTPTPVPTSAPLAQMTASFAQSTPIPTPIVSQTTLPTPVQSAQNTPLTTPVPSAQTTHLTTSTLPQTTPVRTPAPFSQTTPLPTPAPPQNTPVHTPVPSTQTTPLLTPALPQTAPAPSIQTTPLPTPAPPQNTPVHTPVPSTQTTPLLTPALPQTAPAPSIQTTPLPTPALSQTAPAPSTQTTPLPTLAQTTPVPTLCHDQTHYPSQSVPVTIPALTTPAPSQSIPTLPVSLSEVPAQANPCPADFPVASSTPSVCNPVSVPHSITPPAPVTVSAASVPQPLSSFAPFHPGGLGTLPMQPHYPPYMAPVPTSAAMLTPHAASSSSPTPPFPHPTESRPYEPAVSPVAGMGSAAVPEYMSHGMSPHPQHPQHPQHSIPLTQLSQIYQDPLYPGFPQNNKDEPAKVPSFSYLPTGKDLPTDVNVLRFFFNLGLKAFTNPLYPPFSYLAPLTQAYHMKPKVPPPAPSSSPYPPPWQPDNTPSILHMSPNPTHPHPGGSGVDPGGHFEMRSGDPGPSSVDLRGYGGHPHSVPMQPMHPQPPVPWSVAPCPNVFAGIYSAPPAGQYTAPPGPTQGGQPYHSTSVRHPLLPILPSQHRGMDVAMATFAPAIERNEADGKRSTPPVTSGSFSTYGHLHSGAEVEPQQGGGAGPIVQMVSAEGLPRECLEPSMLANGNQRLDYNTKSFQSLASVGLNMYMQSSSPVNELDLEEAEYDNADLTSGRSYYRRPFGSTRRRGHDERVGGGGFRGRSSRGRRDNIGRENQPYYPQRYRGRGRGYVQHSNAGEAEYPGGPFSPAAKT